MIRRPALCVNHVSGRGADWLVSGVNHVSGLGADCLASGVNHVSGRSADWLASGVVFNRHTVPQPGESVTFVKRSH